MRLIISVEGQGGARDALEEYYELREYVEGHAMRVGACAVAVGRAMGLDEPVLRQLVLTAMLHDGGGSGARECSFLAGGEGYCVRVGAAAGSGGSREGGGLLPGDVSRAVRHAHEHWDGTGGPDGLDGVRIPLASRIVLAADAYDVMTGRSGCEHAAAVRFLRRGAGGWFDPEVVAVIAGMEEAELKGGDAAASAGGRALAASPRRAGLSTSPESSVPLMRAAGTPLPAGS